MKKILIPFVLFALGFAGATLIPPMQAHAAAAALPDPVGLDWYEYLGIALAALAGIRTIVDVALAGLKWLAPRTKSTWDDRARDDFQVVHDKLDRLTGLLQGLVPAAKPLTMSQPVPDLRGATGTPNAIVGIARGGIVLDSLDALQQQNPQQRMSKDEMIAAQAGITLGPRNTQSGFARLGCLLGLAGIGVTLALASCTATQAKQVANTAKAALINCTAQDLGTTPGLDVATLVAIANLVTTERTKCSPAGSLDWKCIEADLIGEGKVLGGCTLVKMVAAEMTAPTPAESRLAAAAMVAPPGRPEFEDFRSKVAPGATYHTGSGDW